MAQSIRSVFWPIGFAKVCECNYKSAMVLEIISVFECFHPYPAKQCKCMAGKDCVYIRDAVRKKWLPMSTKVSKGGVTLPNGGKPIFKLMGFYSGPDKIDIDAMNLKFNDGTDKLDAGEDFGSPDPWHNHAGGKPANFP